MSQKTFLFTTGVIFFIVAIAHLFRLIFKWNAVIAGWTVPIAISGIALVFAAYLSYEGFRLAAKSR